MHIPLCHPPDGAVCLRLPNPFTIQTQPFHGLKQGENLGFLHGATAGDSRNTWGCS